jgi:hypothetical protein
VSGALDIEDVNEPAESGSTELRIADLLLEQVAEERAVLFRHHLALPFDAIERCYPVWVKPPEPDEAERWSESVREFFGRIDGHTDLARLFAAVPLEERAARMDRLVLQFRDGRLALLPAPVDALAAGLESATPASAGGLQWWRGLLGRKP